MYSFCPPKKHFECKIDIGCEKYETTYLPIRLRTRNFYVMIVKKGEARVNYRFIEIETNNLIVLV